MKSVIKVGAIIAVTILALLLASFFLLVGVGEAMSEEYPEEVYKEITSPDGTTKLTITHYKRYFPYGVKGNIYLEKNGERKKVRGFFLDFIEDIDNKHEGTEITWSEEDNTFYYGGQKLTAG